MPRNLLPIAAISAALVLPSAARPGEPSFSLTYLDRFKIEEDEGLDEPSGLTLSRGKNRLWSVSDDAEMIFKMKRDGTVSKKDSFAIDDADGLEGLTIDPDGEFLFAVKEDGNEIIKIDIGDETVVSRRPIDQMNGFDEIERHFADDGENSNKGLEGITFDADRGTLLVLKEGVPGLIVEITNDLQSIEGAKLLGEENGFIDDDVSISEIDYSGIQYDDTRKRVWIVSDKARRLFLYDWPANQVIQSAALGYGDGGDYREIEKAEGVALDAEENHLYVVSDEEARLYLFDIR